MKELGDTKDNKKVSFLRLVVDIASPKAEKPKKKWVIWGFMEF